MFIMTIFSNVLKLIFLLLYISIVVDLVFQSTYNITVVEKIGILYRNDRINTGVN